MRSNILVTACAITALILNFACTSSKKSGAEMNKKGSTEILDTYESQTVVPDTFVLPQIPSTLTDPNDREKYLILHFWDRFDFADSNLTKKPHITEQAFVDFIHLLSYVSVSDVSKPLLSMMKSAEADSTMYRYFASLTEKYFYEPNSPFRNEEYYIPILEEVAKSSLLNETERSNYQFQLELVMKNRVGDRANNFSFTLANGESLSLHDINSQYLLLMFSNPGCPTCESVIRQLDQSPSLNKALEMNNPSRTMLTILTIYPDSDVEEWRAHLSQMPQRWIHGYDLGMSITSKRLYDIKAFPTIYLLDKDKKVILKDTSIEEVQSFFSVNN